MDRSLCVLFVLAALALALSQHPPLLFAMSASDIKADVWQGGDRLPLMTLAV
jgi:hypothetical protein